MLFFFLKKFIKKQINNESLIGERLKKFIITKLLKSQSIILMLHRVAPLEINEFSPVRKLKITPEFLEKFIKLALSKGYQFISMDELYEILTSQKNFSHKFVILTFDDGYKDNFVYAYPILKKYDIPFIIYINSGFINKEFFPWWFKIAYLLEQNNVIVYKKRKYKVTSQIEKEKFYILIRNRLINSSKQEINKCIEELLEYNNYNPAKEKDFFMSWEEIKELLKYPKFTLGSHTYNHLNLVLLNEEKKKEEFIKDIKEIENRTNIKVKNISYPFGLVNKKVVSVIQSMPIKTGVSAKPEFISLNSNKFHLPRIYFQEENSGLLKCLISCYI